MTAALITALSAECLFIAGTLPSPTGTRFMVAPMGAAFWPHFTQSPEWTDGQPDPMDRWSLRVLTDIAHHFDGTAILPSDGPPFAPIFDWALQSGGFWQSPIQMLVHAKMGLWASIRGVLDLPLPAPQAPAPTNPCTECAAPCQSACPVNALSPDRPYNLQACHDFLNRPEGKDCLLHGCLARRACPAGLAYGRLAEQSEYHMRQFHP